MCNCIETVSKTIIEKMKKDNEGEAIIGEGNFNNMGLSFGKNSNWRTSQEFEYEFTPIKKSGEQGRQIKKRISMYHSFCPFCGKKVEKQ